jgi:hypothetical protein
VPVLDPTAGNGALLAPWPSDQRFGVEVDGDQVKAGDYHAITGDVQRVFPMLRKLGVQFPQILANPPFGLPWTDVAGRVENSAVAVWRMSLALLAPEGVGAFICGRDRFRREILSREDAAAVFAIVECEDLFDGVDLPCLIPFFVGPDDRSDDGGLLVEAEASREELAERALSHEIKRALCDIGHYFTGSLSYPWVGPVEPWRLVARELERRRREEASQRPTYSVELRARDRLAIRPGPFVRQALAKAGRLKLIETLHNQPVGHFALNALDWRLLGELEQECDLTIAPAVREAVAQVASVAEREVIPLYEVRPQMRLGYLTDLDSILCTRSDPERGFQEGTRYPLRTDSRINVRSGEKVTRNKQGEPVVRKYEEEAKVLVITVGDKEFCESTEDIEYLLRQPDLLADVVVPGRLQPALPLQLRRRARRVRGRLLRHRVHLRSPRLGHRAPPREAQGAPADHQRQPVLAAVRCGDDPPAQARLRRADRPLHDEDRLRADGRRPARALQALAQQEHVRSVLHLEVPRPRARAERPDRAVRRRVRPAHQARVRHHRPGGCN